MTKVFVKGTILFLQCVCVCAYVMQLSCTCRYTALESDITISQLMAVDVYWSLTLVKETLILWSVSLMILGMTPLLIGIMIPQVQLLILLLGSRVLMIEDGW